VARKCRRHGRRHGVAADAVARGRLLLLLLLLLLGWLPLLGWLWLRPRLRRSFGLPRVVRLLLLDGGVRQIILRD
jgi:hypothetical protein